MRKILSVIIGLLILLIILSQIDISLLAEIISQTRLEIIALALAMVVLDVFSKSMKWISIIKAHEEKISLFESAKFFLIGFFLGIITPARVGDLSRAFYLSNKKIPLSLAVSTVIIDRLIDVGILVFLGALAVTGLLVFFNLVVIPIEVVALIIILFLAGIFIFTRKKIVGLLLRPFFDFIIPKKYSEKIRTGFHSFYTHLEKTRKKPVYMLLGIFYGFIGWFFSISFAFFIAISLGMEVPFYFMILVVPIITLIELIPISVSGIGTRDAGVIFLFSFLSISAETAIAFSILYLTVGYLVPAMIGGLLFMKNPIKINN